MKQWYVVYTKAGREKNVTQQFNKKKIEHFYPLTTKMYWRGERQLAVEEPLFKSYVFVHIGENEKKAIKQTEGFMSFVYRLDQPVTVAPEEITAIQDFLKTHRNVTLQRISFRLTDEASHNALSQHLVSELSSSGKSMVSSLGYVLITEPEVQALTPASPYSASYTKKPFYPYVAMR